MQNRTTGRCSHFHRVGFVLNNPGEFGLIPLGIFWGQQMKMSYTPVELSVISAIEDGKIWTPAYFKQWAETMVTDPRTDADLRSHIQNFLEENKDADTDDKTKPEISASAIVSWVSRTDKEYREAVDDRPNWVTPKGIRIKGARITGKDDACLDLGAVEFNYPIEISESILDDGITFHDARLRKLRIVNCEIPFVDGENAHIASNIDIRNSEIAGSCTIRHSTVGGSVVMSGAKLKHTATKNSKDNAIRPRALSARGIVVAGGVYLDEGFSSDGTISLYGANINGHLRCRRGKFHAPGTFSINAESSHIKGIVFMDYGFQSDGNVNLADAKLRTLVCDGGEFVNKSGPALSLWSAHISGEASFVAVEKIFGDVELMGAFADSFLLGESTLKNCSRSKFHIDGFKYDYLGGDLFDHWQSCLKWLERQTPIDYFHPRLFQTQPWRQLERALIELGRNEDALNLAVKREARSSRHRIIRGLTNILLPFYLLVFFLVWLALSILELPIRWFSWTWRNDLDATGIDDESQNERTIGRIQKTLVIWKRTTGEAFRDLSFFIRRYFVDFVAIWFLFVRHVTFGWLTGFGYRPARAIGAAFLIIIIGAAVFHEAEEIGRMRPSETYLIANNPYKSNGAVIDDYVCMRPIVFSVDLFVPLVDLRQDMYWMPIDEIHNSSTKSSSHMNGKNTSRSECSDWEFRIPQTKVDQSFPGWLLTLVASQALAIFSLIGQSIHHVLAPLANIIADSAWLSLWYWFHILSGWVLTALIVAGFSGLLKSND